MNEIVFEVAQESMVVTPPRPFARASFSRQQLDELRAEREGSGAGVLFRFHSAGFDPLRLVRDEVLAVA